MSSSAESFQHPKSQQRGSRKEKEIDECLETIKQYIKSRSATPKSKSKVSSRCSSICRSSNRKNYRDRSSLRNTSTHRKCKLRSSQSDVNIKESFSWGSTYITHNEMTKTIKSDASKSNENLLTDDGESDENGNADYASSITPSGRRKHDGLNKKGLQQAQVSFSRSYFPLSFVVQKLHSTLLLIRRSNFESSKLYLGTDDYLSIPSPDKKGCVDCLMSTLTKLTDEVHQETSNMLSKLTDDKERCEQYKRENNLLQQRLANSLIVQKTLEKENKILDQENKNLAIQIVPYVTRPLNSNLEQVPYSWKERNDGTSTPHSASDRRKSSQVEIFYEHRRDTKANKLDNYVDTTSPDSDTEFPSVSQSKGHQCKSRSSTGFDIKRNCKENGENWKLNRNIYNEKYGGVLDRESELEHVLELVTTNKMDFNKLHGKMHKNLEEIKNLQHTVGNITQENKELFDDLEGLVDGYIMVKKERDNYETMLKMILKEKNSPESNLYELLDSLLVHLNNSMVSSENDQYSHYHHSSGFLENALHVVQEQNISIREEMTRLKDSWHETAGQNELLLSKNDELMTKVYTMQKELDDKDEDAEKMERDVKDKYGKLEKLYNTVLSAKEDLDKCLEEKENQVIKLTNLLETSEQTATCQAKKILELEKINERLERKVSQLKTNVGFLNNGISQLKSSIKDQKGKLCERVKSATNQLQNTKDHCKWLQTQVDNLNLQLADAHERSKLHETDKSILAQKVLAAEEERQNLDRKILEIKSAMEGDIVLRVALSERNEVLQTEINRLRRERILKAAEKSSFDSFQPCFKQDKNACEDNESFGDNSFNNTWEDISSIAPGTPREPSCSPTRSRRDSTPLSRKNRHSSSLRRPYMNIPRAAVSLHTPTVLSYRR